MSGDTLGVIPRPEKLYYTKSHFLPANTLGVTPRFAALYWADYDFLDKLQGNRPHKPPERKGAELLHEMWKNGQCYVWPTPDNAAWKLFDYRWDEHEVPLHLTYPGASIKAVYGNFRKADDYSARYRKFEDRAVLRASFDLRWKPMVALTASVRMAAAIERCR